MLTAVAKMLGRGTLLTLSPLSNKHSFEVRNAFWGLQHCFMTSMITRCGSGIWLSITYLNLHKIFCFHIYSNTRWEKRYKRSEKCGVPPRRCSGKMPVWTLRVLNPELTPVDWVCVLSARMTSPDFISANGGPELTRLSPFFFFLKDESKTLLNTW